MKKLLWSAPAQLDALLHVMDSWTCILFDRLDVIRVLQEAREEASRKAAVERAAQLEALLHAAFADPGHPPDLEFGCFAAVLGPATSGFESEALLRIDTGADMVNMPIFKMPIFSAF